MAKLSNDALLHIVNAKLADARENRSEIDSLNAELERRYSAEPYGTEVPGRSRFVSNDVRDAVESAHSSLIRMFLGAAPIIKFTASNPEDKKQTAEAEEKTKFVDYLIRGQSNSYKTQNSFLKEILKFKSGWLKYYYEETEETEDHEWTGQSEEEVVAQLDALVANKNNKELELVSSNITDTSDDNGLERQLEKATARITEHEENEDGTFNIKVRVKVRRQEIKIVGVPSGSGLISTGAESVDEAELVGDESFKSRGQLLSEGHSRKLVSSLPAASIGGVMSRAINTDELGNVPESDFGEWASELVPISDLYVRVDYNGDGIAERRHIEMSSDIILVNEPFNHVPYAIGSAIITPHSAIGQGWGEQVTDIAEVNTAITRGVLDNIYSVNNVKKIVRVGKDGVNIDEALSNGIGGVIQARGNTPLMDLVMPVVTPFIADKALLVKQHMDQMKAQRVGNQLTSQGLDGDALSKETATRFTGIEKTDQAKIELIARNIVEVPYRKLYEGVAWLAAHNQMDEQEINILGKQLTSNPKTWKYKSSVQTEIGLGAGDNDKVVENMTGLWNISSQLKAEGSKLTDDKKRYNIASKLIKALELKDASLYINDPEEPSEQLMADNEQLNNIVLQQQEQLQQMQNPLAEAEEIKQKAFLLKAQSEAEIKVAQLQLSSEQFQAKLKADAKKSMDELALKLTEMEQKYGKDLNGEMENNVLVFDPAIGDFVNAAR